MQVSKTIPPTLIGGAIVVLPVVAPQLVPSHTTLYPTAGLGGAVGGLAVGVVGFLAVGFGVGFLAVGFGAVGFGAVGFGAVGFGAGFGVGLEFVGFDFGDGALVGL